MGHPIVDADNATPCRHLTTTPHPTMSGAELEALFAETWKVFYSTEHVARMLRH
ncbi:hypothetical protein [Endothiovibrio diazotrophicus]